MAPSFANDQEGFTPAAATNSKTRKLARQSNNTNIATSSKKNKRQPGASSMFLSTQPTLPSTGDDNDMGFERLPLYDPSSSKLDTLNGALKVQGGDAEAAMKMDMDSAEEDDDEDEDEDEDDTVMIDPSSLSKPTPVTRTPLLQIPGADILSFPAVSHTVKSGLTQRRKVTIPQHRMTPLKRDWIKIYSPLVEECGLQVRMNLPKRWVEMKTSKHTPSPSSLTRAADFLGAYALGFSVEDAIALLRLEELYIESFEVKDVKTLHGDHLSRAIGRIAGHEGKTRFVIENASRTRVVLADTKIHILGTFSNIKIARDAICALILGSPPGKIYAGLRQVASRSRERF